MKAVRNRTVRARLALLLAALIGASGIVFLSISYVLVEANSDYNVSTAPAPAKGHEAGSLRQGRSPRATADAPFTVTAEGDQVLHRTNGSLLLQYAAVLAGVMLLAAAAAWLIAGRLLRPLKTITRTARRITGERLDQRLDLPGPRDELKELGDTFDSMLGRLQSAFETQQLFAANAAHELRTPLGVMHAELDLAIRDEAATPAERRDALLRLRRTVIACERLTERLLSLTRSRLVDSETEPVALDTLIGERIELAELNSSEIEIRTDLDPTFVEGDPQLLGLLVENLIENSIKHNERDGWVEISLRSTAGEAVLSIANSGPWLGDEKVDELVEPFRRAAQQRIGSGHGIGLSIVRTIVEAHGGELSLEALVAGGLRVTVVLPALSHPLRPRPATALRRWSWLP